MPRYYKINIPCIDAPIHQDVPIIYFKTLTTFLKRACLRCVLQIMVKGYLK